jgi:hypothetical protein
MELLLLIDIELYPYKMNLIIDVLNELSKYKIKSVFEFFEISRYSFNCFNEHHKPKEGHVMILKEMKGTKTFNQLCYCLHRSDCFTRWDKKWLVLRDDMICFLDNISSNIAQEVFKSNIDLLV